MPNTYSQIYLQFVFAVRHRERAIPKEHKEELHKYITGLVTRRQAKLLAVHCMPDHAHLYRIPTGYFYFGIYKTNQG